jgi:hypothetical protein
MINCRAAARAGGELGMFLDANAELEEIHPEVRHVPEVLEVRMQIYSALKKWELMQTVAKRLAIHDPDEPKWTALWAYATRRADSIESRTFQPQCNFFCVVA